MLSNWQQLKSIFLETFITGLNISSFQSFLNKCQTPSLNSPPTQIIHIFVVLFYIIVCFSLIRTVSPLPSQSADSGGRPGLVHLDKTNSPRGHRPLSLLWIWNFQNICATAARPELVWIHPVYAVRIITGLPTRSHPHINGQRAS